MQTKTNFKNASYTTFGSLVAAARTVPLEATVRFAADGEVVVDGKRPASNLSGLTGLLTEVGSSNGEQLRLIALRRAMARTPAQAMTECIVVENLRGRKRAYTPNGSLPLDRLSADLVQAGHVYRGKVTQNGFVLVDPADEVVLSDGRQLLPQFGRVPHFIFDAVWQVIRDREAARRAIARQRIAERETDAMIGRLAAGSVLTLGGMGLGVSG